MKWLYRILRLFFCPHKWDKEGKYGIKYSFTGKYVGFVLLLKCRRCGNHKSKKVGIA